MTTALSRRTLLISAGAAALAVACSRGSSTGGNGRTVRFLVPSDTFAEAVQAGLGPDFASRTGITVKTELAGGGGNWQDVDGRLATQLAANTPPTIAAVGTNAVFTYAQAGLLQPLDNLMGDNGFNPADYIEPFRKLNQYEGQTVAALYRLSAMVMSYNTKAFTDAGLDPNTPPATWAELRAAATAIVDRGAARYGVLHSYNADSNWTFENFIDSAGGAMMDDRRHKITFTDEPGARVLTYWRTLIAENVSTPTTTPELDDAFIRRDAAMVFGPSTRPARYSKEASFDFRTTMIPVPDGGTRRLPPGGGSLAIFTKDKDEQQAAWQVIEALISPTGQTELSKRTGDIPVSKLATGPEYLGSLVDKEPFRRAALESIDFLVPRFQFPGTNPMQINDVLQENIYAALTGATQPQQALDDAASRAAALLP